MCLGVVIGHNFHSSFLSIFDPTSHTFFIIPFPLMFIFLMFLLCLILVHEQTTRTRFDWYYRSQWSTWLLTSWNSPVPPWPPNPVLELPWPLLPVPTVQSSRLPGHGAWVGVHPPHEDLNWLQGSLSVLQQDLPDRLPPFNELCPLILWGTHWTWPAQGRLLHQPPGLQWHCPMESW